MSETGVDEAEARELALFLVRIFGDQAGNVAAERAGKSEQKDDWARVGTEVERLLADEEAAADDRPLRLFT
jgi:hypothetical protein